MAKDNRLLSGNTDMIILKILSEADSYGYQITQKLSDRSEHLFELKEGTLYPLLHMMENDGMVVSYEKTTESGKKRKYYHITDSGLKHLSARKAAWDSYCSAINQILADDSL